MVVSPQSHGDLLTLHPHAHSICSLGLFRPDGVYLPMEHVDFSGLESVFRERFFRLMLRRQKVRPETVERMRAWDHSGFNVDFARRIDADDRGGLEGLLSYMERAPVSLRRLTYRSDGMVHYQGINRPIRLWWCKPSPSFLPRGCLLPSGSRKENPSPSGLLCGADNFSPQSHLPSLSC